MRELLSICALLAGIGLVALYAYRWGISRGFRDGYQQGHEKGYTRGRQSEENWWIGAESEVDRERVKIWREET